MTLYNGVELDRFQEEGSDHRSDVSDDGQRVIGFIGQIVPRKGLLTLIEALPSILREIPDAVLVVLGCSPPHDDRYETACRDAVRRLELARHVRFVGFCEDVPAWLRTFDVMVLPSRNEPFGKVIIEAMAAACPVIASAVDGIPEIISSPRYGTLVTPDDVHGVASAVVRVLADPQHADAIRTEARAYVHRRFGIRNMIDGLQDVYWRELGVPRANARCDQAEPLHSLTS